MEAAANPALGTSVPTPSNQQGVLIMAGMLFATVISIIGFTIIGAVKAPTPAAATIILSAGGTAATAMIGLTGIVVKAYLDTAKAIEVIKKDVNSQMTEMLRMKEELTDAKELAAEARGVLAGMVQGKAQAADHQRETEAKVAAAAAAIPSKPNLDAAVVIENAESVRVVESPKAKKEAGG